MSVERKHGAEGPRVIAETIGRYAAAGEEGAVEMWRALAKRYEHERVGKLVKASAKPDTRDA